MSGLSGAAGLTAAEANDPASEKEVTRVQPATVANTWSFHLLPRLKL